ncbi:prolyl oligopeptidase family serine peptidase [Cryptosporangium aurantiacum]|uniref:Prolyl oligopeptidase family protein n=1 Tax=Cryptosporangium aurantiacum TaxID=134849 RepID=A0A1M7RQA5_9ACTN|nr:prolyl oligopeptidase family serine peptidase [Cryptosporangium aurantiacum]SHN48228.1 Prolyl oligopeptidase family protein [Cryptosporangium aurantiacum]
MEPIRGVAAGVPFLALPPADGGPAPLVVVWHLMDAPRTEVAMAAALPLNGVPAWRVYLGLPLMSTRTPAGGFEEIMALMHEDSLLKVHGYAITQAAAELPAVLDALREQLPPTALVDAPLSLVGGSAGGGAALLALTESKRPVAAVAAINAAVRATAVVELVEQAFGIKYAWSDESRQLAARLDSVARADEIAARRPQAAVLIVSGEEDHPTFLADAAALRDALQERYADPAAVTLTTIPGLAHPLALEPGLEAAPQLPQAVEVDAAVSAFLARYLPAGAGAR